MAFNHFQVSDGEDACLTSVLCMKVRDAMLFVVDSDYDAEESTDFRHR